MSYCCGRNNGNGATRTCAQVSDERVVDTCRGAQGVIFRSTKAQGLAGARYNSALHGGAAGGGATKEQSVYVCVRVGGVWGAFLCRDEYMYVRGTISRRHITCK